MKLKILYHKTSHEDEKIKSTFIPIKPHIKLYIGIYVCTNVYTVYQKRLSFGSLSLYLYSYALCQLFVCAFNNASPKLIQICVEFHGKLIFMSKFIQSLYVAKTFTHFSEHLYLYTCIWISLLLVICSTIKKLTKSFAAN